VCGLLQGVVTDADATTALLRQMLAIDQSQLRSFFGVDAHARTRVWRMRTCMEVCNVSPWSREWQYWAVAATGPWR
jgi:hypothetical protein